MKAHRTDLVSFFFGLVFLGLATWWLLARIMGLAVPPVGWFLAGGLVLIGVLGLLGALRSSRAPEGCGTPNSPEVTVAVPYRDDAPADDLAGPGRAGPADEWSTGATTDVPEPATRELPPVDAAPDEPRVPGRTPEGPAA
ncbi:hypothetical protein [Micromonospora sp. DT31]|uniref:hypothetical protein n=1 Tax=Micromonospora sp. DT31 TaxID=3393434 RepID=UPI003CF31709